MLKLMPILEHMGACDESRMWLHEKNFATFAEAFGACPNGKWINWIVARLADDGNVLAYRLWNCANIWNVAESYADQRTNIERWLVEYAHKHGCAVEVAL